MQLGTATTWQSVSAGRDHSLAVRTDGTLWGWGNNNYGQARARPFQPALRSHASRHGHHVAEQRGGALVQPGRAHRRHALGRGQQRLRHARRRHHDGAHRPGPNRHRCNLAAH
ncbi:RCC1-like domain-containing protein [Hymenobacter humi]|uniref:RCC1-like domain-containing protein n=1 Tax=Hymenobacter humi TaxID=1411620 RepID=A0ABW2UGS3_9BACT